MALKKKSEIAGLPVSDMPRDQKHLVEKVMCRPASALPQEGQRRGHALYQGGRRRRHPVMSFYKNLDIGNDGVWDVWQLESPNMVWYFRGAPHVHTWVNIRSKA